MRLSKHLARLSCLAVASTALAGALAGPGNAASPGTVEVSNGKIVYTAGKGGRNSASITVFNGKIAVFDTEPLTPKAGCVKLTPRAVTCGTSALKFVADLGDGNDSFSVGVDFKGIVKGGPGDDTFIASTKQNTPRRLTFSGGEGTDTVSYKSSNRPVRVSLDNQPNDGRAIDSDNIRDDVENIVGSTFGGDTLTGSAAANRLDDGGGSGERLNGLGGDDLLLAKDLAKDSFLACGEGDADVIVLDKGIDPEPLGCEEVREF
ncbi:hypothetical protein [Thermoactinospora rubra]|uniref:hypothetical protein n=1 Tax=Thermoactinospora rubra TaxID=1088767 RepID=UPI000A102A9D|nr:hypothetical protein [Thermoactinospora rubra]